MAKKRVTEDDLWAALIIRVPPLGQGEKTAKMVAEERGVVWTTALRYLKEWEEAGKVVQVGERKLPNGSVSKAWKVVT